MGDLTTRSEGAQKLVGLSGGDLAREHGVDGPKPAPVEVILVRGFGPRQRAAHRRRAPYQMLGQQPEGRNPDVAVDPLVVWQSGQVFQNPVSDSSDLSAAAPRRAARQATTR